jgi:Fe-S cluster assembly protein SufD
MTTLMEDKDTYLAHFAALDKEMAAVGPPSFQRLRKAAIGHFAKRGFPTLKDEEWRFTNLAPLLKVPFKPADAFDLDADQLRSLAPASDGTRLVFVNGEWVRDLSTPHPLPEGAAVSLVAAIQAFHSDLVEPYLARHARYQSNAFVALNTALFRNGAFLYVPRGTVLTDPIHLVFVSTAAGEPSVSHPRTLIVVGENSQVTLVESYVGPDDEVSFTNAVTEVVAGENAVIDHYKVLREGNEAFHVATLQVQQARSSNFSSHNITLGGLLVRNDVNAVLDGEGCECTLNGLYLGSGEQLIDNHTRIDHARPHSASHELYKGILDGRAKGVFNGKIYVHPDAQKTDAKQTNQTLLLSEDATIDTKPQLEIFADDVKCTHGATVGQLDADSLFYLRARGIGLAEARSLLIYAFANDIVGRVKVEPVRRQLEELLLTAQHLPKIGVEE